MIKKRYIFILVPLVLLFIGVLVIGALGYFLFSRKAGNAEIVFPATKVGIPQGERVAQDIGPAGGSISSPDGRMTLTIPPDALTEKMTFSIQPITNMAPDGLGSGYRLEPDGQKFPTPIELAIKYDDRDVENTAPPFLALTYQKKDGTWLALRTTNIDEINKTLTVESDHFTDVSFQKPFKVSPDKATLRVGESLSMEFVGITPRPKTLYFHFAKKFGAVKPYVFYDGDVTREWLADMGTITEEERRATADAIIDRVSYTAPAKKPPSGIATIAVPYGGKYYDNEGNIHYVRGLATAHITIVDRGYRVSGNAGGDTVFEGVICDLEKPFKLSTNNPFLSSFAFEPSSSSGGSWKFATKYGITGGGGGNYRLDGPETERTALVMDGSSVGCVLGGCRSGDGEVRLTLTPLAANEGWCGE